MLERLKRLLGFVAHHPKDAAIIGLSLICIFLNWQIGSEGREAERSRVIAGDLPTDTQQVVTIYRDRVITKWREGPTKIEYRDRYLPPEGHVEFVTKKDQPDQAPEMRIKDRGFIFRLGGGMIYSERFLLQADAKFVYWKRYGLVVGINSQFGGLGVGRHLDDLTPFTNLELLGMVGLGWKGNVRLGLGLRTNF